MRERISRRTFIQLGAMGVGVGAPLGLLVARTSASSPTPAGPPTQSLERDAVADARFAALIGPTVVGTTFGALRVTNIGVDWRGVGVVTLADVDGRTWGVEVARRTAEDAAYNPLTLSADYSFYLNNRGNGATRTDEPVGRAVLALAQQVTVNETVVSVSLPSRAEVWAKTGRSALREQA